MRTDVAYTRLTDGETIQQPNANRRRFVILVLIGAAIIFVLNEFEFVDGESVPKFVRRPEVEHVDCARIFSGDEEYTEEVSQKRIPLKVVPKFVRRPEVEHVDCARIFSGDEEYTATVAQKRIPLKEDPNLNMSCAAIRQRVIGQFPAPKINYSIAFAKDVHTDYEYLEFGLGNTYSTENHYCFSVDVKAGKEFQMRMRQIAACLPNVYVAAEMRDMDSSGHNINRGHLDCLYVLVDKPVWEYAILQQNYDTIAHSNAEMSEILKIINGSNDVEVRPLRTWRFGPRVDMGLDWSVDHLRLFTNRTKMTAEQRKNAHLSFAKGYVQASLTRAAVEWMTREVDLAVLVEQLNQKEDAVDEQFISTLQNSESLLMPGGYHSACTGKQKPGAGFITRYTDWSGKCKTKYVRHLQCVFGVENLVELRKKASRYIMVNKFLPGFDFSALSCLSERIFNRTHFGAEPIDRKYFESHIQLNYNKLKQTPGFDISTYKCCSREEEEEERNTWSFRKMLGLGTCI